MLQAKKVFNERTRTANLKMTWVRVVLCTCVHGIDKSCSSDLLRYFLSNINEKNMLK